MQGDSAWRPLREAETEAHGGSSRRVLYGCVVTMINSSSPTCSSLPDSRILATIDAYPSLALTSQIESFKASNGLGVQFGSRSSFKIASATQSTISKQLLLTWSRVC